MTTALWDLLDQALVRETKDYPRNPAAYIHERLNEETWSKQEEILDSVRDHKRTAVKSCHGVGKSHIASRLAAWWIDVHEPGTAFVVSTAPTHAQVEGVLWRYIGQAWRKYKLRGKVTGDCKWKVDGELVGWGRKPADHDASGFQGIHAPKVLVILDEACGIPEQLWIAAEAITTNDDCRIVAIGNPDDPNSHFAKVCKSRLWNVLRISAYDSPAFTGEEVSASLLAQLTTRQWVEDLKEALGEDNPIFISKALGDFPPDDPNSLVRLTDVMRCREFDVPRLDSELEPVWLGVDVGSGGDETVIRERRGLRVGRQWRNRHDQPDKVAESILEAIIETGATRVNVDGDGIGWGIVGALRLYSTLGRHNAAVVAIRAGQAASDPSRFANVKAEIWWEIGREMSRKRLWDLSTLSQQDFDEVAGQLCMPRWDLTPTGQIRVEKKEDVIARLGRSPDNADALLYAFYAGQGAAAETFLDQLARSKSTT